MIGGFEEALAMPYRGMLVHSEFFRIYSEVWSSPLQSVVSGFEMNAITEVRQGILGILKNVTSVRVLIQFAQDFVTKNFTDVSQLSNASEIHSQLQEMENQLEGMLPEIYSWWESEWNAENSVHFSVLEAKQIEVDVLFANFTRIVSNFPEETR